MVPTRDLWADRKSCQVARGGLAPVGGVPHDEEVQTPSHHRRARIAALRAAVIRAHPDHGGTTESLQRALEMLRAEVNQVAGSNLANQSINTEPLRHTSSTSKGSGLLSGIASIAFWLVRVWLGVILASMVPLLVIRLIMMFR